jgi:hypothetical protein
VVLHSTAGQECKQEHTVDGATIKEYDEPPLKKFVTAPRLKEDLAKCAGHAYCSCSAIF